VQSSLLTLWDVQDRSTSEFMKTFYEFLAVGRNKAEALRDAVLRLRKTHRHPYYWAPFVLNGKVFNE
jgi:CHAT domain-containing protein